MEPGRQQVGQPVLDSPLLLNPRQHNGTNVVLCWEMVILNNALDHVLRIRRIALKVCFAAFFVIFQTVTMEFYMNY